MDIHRNNLNVVLPLAVLCTVLVASYAAAQAAAPKTERARVDELFDFWTRQDQPGFAVVVVKEGTTVYQKVMGLACQEHGVAITPKTVFHASTLTMPVTGLAVLMLESEGKLSLDDSIRTHLSDLPEFCAPIKIRHLLYQTSGLWDWLAILTLQGRETDEITLAQVLRIVSSQKKLSFPPGGRFQPSHTNYDLLAEIVRKVTGKPLSEWAWERIFKPLKMTRTLLRDNFRAVIENQAFSYNYDRVDYKKGNDFLSIAGSHGLLTTIEDMGRWLANLSTGEVGGPELIARTLQTGLLTDGTSTGFAAGYVVDSGTQGVQVRQTGRWAGSGAVVTYDPARRLGIVVLSNWDYTGVNGFPQDIADIYSPREDATTTKAASKPRAPVKVTPEILDRYVGDYRVDPDGPIYTISRDGDQLVLGVGRGKYPLAALSPTEFELAFASLVVTFTAKLKGPAGQATLQQGRAVDTAKRLSLVKPNAAELAELAGAYRNEELDLRLSIELRGDRLALIQPGKQEVVLSPDEKDQFTSASPVFPMVAFRRDAGGKVTAFVADTASLRDVVFAKQ